jgi:hypothetical protein
MRPEDAAEVLAFGGYSPLAALLDSLRLSDRAYAILFDGELAGLFGIVPGPFLVGEAVPWLLTGDAIERHPVSFWRASREVVAYWSKRYPVLVQWVDARYARALRWAERLGFNVESPAPLVSGGLPFCRISLRRA